MQFRVSDHRLCRSDTYNINCKSYLHTKCRIPIQISLPNANMFPHIISQIHVFGKCFHRFYRIRALLIRALLIRALLLRARVVRALHLRAFFLRATSPRSISPSNIIYSSTFHSSTSLWSTSPSSKLHFESWSFKLKLYTKQCSFDFQTIAYAAPTHTTSMVKVVYIPNAEFRFKYHCQMRICFHT